MRNVRFAATATLLANGHVLIAGGVAHEGASSATAELYDPATRGFALTGGLLTGRSRHTATLLQTGKVLITGGIDKDGKPVRAAELYDPASGRFLATGNMLEGRYDHTATLLANGKVLITGGGTTTRGVTNTDTAELYDPASGTFSHTGTVTRYYDTTSEKFFYKGQMNATHAMHTATLLPNGDVVIAGGMDADGKPQALVEIYHPASGKFALTTKAFPHTGTAMTDVRCEHTASILPNGQVLIAGGSDTNGVLATAELYDPAQGTFTCVGGRSGGPISLCKQSMTDFRTYALAVPLADGQVLIAGGYNTWHNRTAAREKFSGPVAFNILNSAEIYNPASGAFTSTTTLVHARYGSNTASTR